MWEEVAATGIELFSIILRWRMNAFVSLPPLVFGAGCVLIRIQKFGCRCTVTVQIVISPLLSIPILGNVLKMGEVFFFSSSEVSECLCTILAYCKLSL